MCRTTKRILKGCLIFPSLQVKKKKIFYNIGFFCYFVHGVGSGEILSHSFTVFTMTSFFLIWYFSKYLIPFYSVVGVFVYLRKGHLFHFTFSVYRKLNAFAFPFQMHLGNSGIKFSAAACVKSFKASGGICHPDTK